MIKTIMKAQKKDRYDKLLKSFLVVIIFSGMTLLASCLIFALFMDTAGGGNKNYPATKSGKVNCQKKIFLI